MKLNYVPLLQIQREIHGLPRNYDRFKQYLRTIFQRDGEDEELYPLIAMNPMGREHMNEMLDALLAIDADGVGVRAAAETEQNCGDVPGEAWVALVVMDDLKGGWTSRWDFEFKFRFGPESLRDRVGPAHVKRNWLTALVWVSEPVTVEQVRQTVLTTIYRGAYFGRHGVARTLRERLAQEGQVMAQAGCTSPALSDDDLAYTREVIEPLLGADDMRTTIECLFGDEAAKSLGFQPRGLSPWAGVALALHDARAKAAASC